MYCQTCYKQTPDHVYSIVYMPIFLDGQWKSQQHCYCKPCAVIAREFREQFWEKRDRTQDLKDWLKI